MLEEAGLAKRLEKLVPAWLERVEPPLGFRNLHTIDLTRWDGWPRGGPVFDQLLDEIARLVGREPQAPPYRPLRDYEASWRNLGALSLSQFPQASPLQEGERSPRFSELSESRPPAGDPHAQQEEFDAAMAMGTIEALDGFLAKYQLGPLINTAKREREWLLREHKEAQERAQTATIAPSISSAELTGEDIASTAIAKHPLDLEAERERQDQPGREEALFKNVSAPEATPKILAPLGERAPAPLTREEEAALRPGDVFKEAQFAPEMVVVPAGSFPMGTPEYLRHFSDEGPQHTVRIAKPFAAGRFAVTFDEWDAFVAGGHDYSPDDCGWGRGRHPVINVSWDEAQAYLAWLSKKTAKRYRLLSEAEWEYAARAGTNTPFWQGESIETSQAHFEKYEDNPYPGTPRLRESLVATVPVDSFEPNGFGLYNVHGNVFEWLEDIWHDNYQGAPSDGSAWTTDANGGTVKRALAWLAARPFIRVARGGSWDKDADYARSAYRYSAARDTHRNDLGFRCARDLE